MSERWFTHASPTLYNSGTNRPQLSSCFLLAMKDDSIEGNVGLKLKDLLYCIRIVSSRYSNFIQSAVFCTCACVVDRDLRHAEAVCTHLEERRRHRSRGALHPLDRLLHRRHERHLERPAPDAASFQQHRQIRGSGRKQGTYANDLSR